VEDVKYLLARVERLEAALREVAEAESRDVWPPDAYAMFVARLASIAKSALEADDGE
jgi:hypothetical protein